MTQYLSLDYLQALSFKGADLTQLNEHAEKLFEAYKHTLAKKHLEGVLKKREEAVLLMLSQLTLIAAHSANELAGVQRWRTNLPTIAECFAREAEDNAPLSKELAAAVNGAYVIRVPEVDSDENYKRKKRHVLSDETIALIRAELISGKLKSAEIARKYGCHDSTVCDIKHGRNRFGKDKFNLQKEKEKEAQAMTEYINNNRNKECHN